MSCNLATTGYHNTGNGVGLAPNAITTPYPLIPKDELTFVPVWIKFHGVPVSTVTSKRAEYYRHSSWHPRYARFMYNNHMYAILGRMDYVRALVDIRVGRALMDTMMSSVPFPVFCYDDTQCPKRVIADLRNLRNQRGMSNDVFQSVQRNDDHDHLVGKIGREEGNEKLMDDLVDGFASPNPFDVLTKEDEKSILRNLKESDDDADVENGYDETATSSKSLDNFKGGNT
ncbi:hypothetical protein Tco_1448303 [Tanacetum coccineum]